MEIRTWLPIKIQAWPKYTLQITSIFPVGELNIGGISWNNVMVATSVHDGSEHNCPSDVTLAVVKRSSLLSAAR